jgi:hypothetical protein
MFFIAFIVSRNHVQVEKFEQNKNWAYSAQFLGKDVCSTITFPLISIVQAMWIMQSKNVLSAALPTATSTATSTATGESTATGKS